MNPQYINQQPPGNFGGPPPVSNYGGGPPLPYGGPPQNYGPPSTVSHGGPPPQGYGSVPPSSTNQGYRPPSQGAYAPPTSSPPTFNGPGMQPPRDPPAGSYGPPQTKPGVPLANGPQPTNQPPPQAANPQFRPAAPGGQPLGGPPPGPRGPTARPGAPPTSTSHVTNQMGAMNISGPPPRPGVPGAMGAGGDHRAPLGPSTSSTSGPMPPSSMLNNPPSMQPGMPPYSQPPAGGSMPPGGNAPPAGSIPPPSQHMRNPPTSNVAGPSPLSHPGQNQPMGGAMPPGPPTMGGPGPRPGMPGPPVSQYGAPPTSQYAGHAPPPPANQFGGQAPVPPSNQYGSQGHPPSSQYGGQAPIPPGGQMGGQHPPPPSPGHQMPPGTGQFPHQPGYPAMGAQAAQPQQPPRRLDPDQMPSPIQVIEDDKRNRAGIYQSSQQVGVPPLVTTNFIVEDQGSCNPRFMRSTMYNIPCTNEMMKQSHMPLAITLTPFARLHPKENAPPLVDLGQLGPIRCNRCKAYMCPYMQFIDGGRKFQCCFCGCSTEVPPEYFAHLDHTGRRVDTYDRPELCLGAYEFVATSDYCKDNKMPGAPAFIFMIDVSYNSIKSGLVHLLCERLKEDVLPNLPKEEGMEESEIRIGFVTYAKELHFYNVKGTLAQPQMMVVSDVQDVFVPLLDGFLVTLAESEAVIDSLLSQIPTMFAESRETEIVLGPVIQAGLDALKSADISGKLFVFHSSLPIAEAPGKLKNRDDRKLMGTDKEKTVLTPQNNFYTKLGQECVEAGCSVDLYLFPNSYIDIATISEVSRLTGGSVYKYTYFQADLDGVRLMEDLKNNISRPIAFDSIIRLRTSTGIRPVDFLGNFFMSNTTDVELASVDCDKSITVELKHDDKLAESDGGHVQAAVLFTSCSGKRRLRIINMAFNVCNQMSDLFRNCELDVVVNYLAKLSIRQCLNTSPKQVREDLMNRCAQILACYRKNCASPSSAGQLILPECMKLLPVYTNCIIKSALLQGGTEVSLDDRSYIMHTMNGMGIKASHVFFYPRLIPLHDVDTEATAVPSGVRCSYERLREDGVYLLENGMVMFLWIGHNANPEWIQNVFGVQSAAQIDIDKSKLHDLDNAMSRRIRAIIKRVYMERHRHMKLFVVRQRDKLEPVFQQYLMEDRSANGSASYVDFLCHIHKEIRNLLS